MVRTSSSPSVRLLGGSPPSSPRAAAGSPGRGARRRPDSCKPWLQEVAALSPGADARLDESDADCRSPCSAKLHLRHSLYYHMTATALFWCPACNRLLSKDARGRRGFHSLWGSHKSRAPQRNWLLRAQCHWGQITGAQTAQVSAWSWASAAQGSPQSPGSLPAQPHACLMSLDWHTSWYQ